MDLLGESFRLQLVGKLPEFVEIDARSESEGVGNRLWRRMTSARGGLADACADYSIDRFLKRNAEVPGALLQ
jgi:hypothetical protein